MSKKYKHQLPIAMTDEMLGDLNELADKHHTSRASLCRIAIEMYIADMKDVNIINNKKKERTEL